MKKMFSYCFAVLCVVIMFCVSCDLTDSYNPDEKNENDSFDSIKLSGLKKDLNGNYILRWDALLNGGFYWTDVIKNKRDYYYRIEFDFDNDSVIDFTKKVLINRYIPAEEELHNFKNSTNEWKITISVESNDAGIVKNDSFGIKYCYDKVIFEDFGIFQLIDVKGVGDNFIVAAVGVNEDFVPQLSFFNFDQYGNVLEKDAIILNKVELFTRLSIVNVNNNISLIAVEYIYENKSMSSLYQYDKTSKKLSLINQNDNSFYKITEYEKNINAILTVDYKTGLNNIDVVLIDETYNVDNYEEFSIQLPLEDLYVLDVTVGDIIVIHTVESLYNQKDYHTYLFTKRGEFIEEYTFPSVNLRSNTQAFVSGPLLYMVWEDGSNYYLHKSIIDNDNQNEDIIFLNKCNTTFPTIFYEKGNVIKATFNGLKNSLDVELFDLQGSRKCILLISDNSFKSSISLFKTDNNYFLLWIDNLSNLRMSLLYIE